MLVHLLNLNIVRRSSFEDEVHPAENVRLIGARPFRAGCSVRAVTADEKGTSGILPSDFHGDSQGGMVESVRPRLDLSAILILEPSPRK